MVFGIRALHAGEERRTVEDHVCHMRRRIHVSYEEKDTWVLGPGMAEKRREQ